MHHDLIVIGAGAAGVFAAIQAKKMHPQCNVLILEKTAVCLAKVRISGGGRCNVTHSLFDPLQLSKKYPRGSKELISPFHRFQPKDMIQWLEERGVELKTEPDGRMFPITDDSATIINALLQEAKKLKVEIRMRQKIQKISKYEFFELEVNGEILTSDQLLLATGSSPQGHKWAEELGHLIEPPIPSLFTFHIPDSPFKELSGISIADVELEMKGTNFIERGPLLITHFGLSGPAVIRLSAWAAKWLNEKKYRTELSLNWVPNLSKQELVEKLFQLKKEPKNLYSQNPFEFPKKFWKLFLSLVDPLLLEPVSPSHKILNKLTDKLHKDTYFIDGKTTNKEEFVTCGGVNLQGVNFKTLESNRCRGLFFAGEILDIDGVTGGFNFQNAWTTGWIAGSSVLSNK